MKLSRHAKGDVELGKIQNLHTTTTGTSTTSATRAASTTTTTTTTATTTTSTTEAMGITVKFSGNAEEVSELY